ncbi:Flp pilus assembly protein CpaB [Actinomycetota bacterium]
MRLRIILLIVAVIIGIVAVVAVVSYISTIRSSVEKEVEKVEVLVAAQNIPKEVPVEILISSEFVVLEAIPQKYLADGVLVNLDDFDGYVTAAPINDGEQITTTKFVKPEQIGLAFTIPNDMVALSIPVTEIIGVSFLFNVGDKVNVIATFIPEETDEEADETTGTGGETTAETTLDTAIDAVEAVEDIVLDKEITRTLLWNVEILHIGIRSLTYEEEFEAAEGTDPEAKEEEISGIRTVTLALTPEQAEKMVFTEEMGSVWLALLPVDGIEKEDTPGQTFENIFEE